MSRARTSTAHMGSFCFPSSLSLGSVLNTSAAPPLMDDRPQKVTCRDGHYEFMRSQYLGAGTYGIVYKAQDCATDQTVVIKQMKVIDTDDLSMQPTSIREVSLLRSVRCPHIIRLLGTFWTPSDDFCLVFEHCSMDLAKFMSSRRQDICVDLARKWAHQMLSGLHYLHAHRIMHRDLKPQNILLTFGSFDIKIADFGLGKEFSVPIRSATLEVVTLWYRAPELLLGCNRYGAKIDVWSVGCIMAEVATLGQPLFDGYCEWEMLMNMFQFLGTPDLHAQSLQHLAHLKHFNAKFPKFKAKKFKSKMGILKEDKLACDLIKNMLTLDWSTRLNANQLLQHPWFEGMDDVTVPQILKDDANGDDDEKTFGNETKTKMISSENRLANLENERMELNEEDKHSEVDGKKARKRNRKQMGINDGDGGDDDGIVGMKHVCKAMTMIRKKRKTV